MLALIRHTVCHQVSLTITSPPLSPTPSAPGASYLTAGHIDKEVVGEFMKEIGKHPDLDETTIAKLLALESQQHEHHSRGWYRINASRSMAGRQKVSPYVDPHVMEVS